MVVAILIVGATRGLGASLASAYAADAQNVVYGTTRSSSPPRGSHISPSVNWVTGIDLGSPGVGRALVNQLDLLGVGNGMVERCLKGFDVVIVTAGYFATEDFRSGPNWDDEVEMYTISAIAPPVLVHSLYRASLLPRGSKILLVSSESGSITLRHPHEGGGNYAHHGSKAASNMVGKLLSLDLHDHGVTVSIVHPGFMRTDMTRGVGFDKYWDAAGAVAPDEAAASLVKWVEDLSIDKSGEYWAPRGPRDIGTAEVVLGKNLPTPLHLPW